MTRMPPHAALLAVAGLALVAGCTPPEATSTGVGFGDYETYLTERGPERAAREAQLTGREGLTREDSGAPAAGNPVAGLTAADLASAGIGVNTRTPRAPAPTTQTAALGQTAAATPGAPLAAPGIAEANAAPVQTSAVTPQAAGGGSVIQRADAAISAAEAPPPASTASGTASGIAAARPSGTSAAAPSPDPSLLTVASVQPRATQPVPQSRPTPAQTHRASAPAAAAPTARATRSGSGEPDIVAYALSTNHAVGTEVYARGVLSRGKGGRACARYHGSDQAQRAFLQAGGPQRDRHGLDPDGDGFACDWTPEPFRAAVRG